MSTTPLSDLLKLSTEERIRLAQDLWDSIPATAAPPLSEAERGELERRLAAHEQDPSSSVPHDALRAGLRARFGA
jgi:putative addiction module component (TIGR02574 family)